MVTVTVTVTLGELEIFFWATRTGTGCQPNYRSFCSFCNSSSTDNNTKKCTCTCTCTCTTMNGSMHLKTTTTITTTIITKKNDKKKDKPGAPRGQALEALPYNLFFFNNNNALCGTRTDNLLNIHMLYPLDHRALTKKIHS